MEDMLLKLWKRHFAWRPNYYRRLVKTRHYLKNYRQIVQAAESTSPTHFEFRAGYTFTLTDASTSLQVFDEIFVHDHYRLPTGHAASTIVDLGANIGLFSLYAHLKRPHATVFAIEANPGTFQVLARNLETHSLKSSIRPFNLAISSQTGHVPFYCTQTTGWSSLYNLWNAENGEAIDVYSVSLSSFCRDHDINRIDFLKVDIEGAEYDVILGDRRVFDIPIQEMVLEVDRNPRDQRYTFHDLLECLRSHYRSVTIAYPGWPDYPLVRCSGLKT